MHSKFQLRNLTKVSEFNERTYNYLQKKNTKKKDIEKITEPNLLSEHDIFPAAYISKISCDKRSVGMIRHENNTVLFF